MDDYINNLIDEAINELASDSIKKGAESLTELAHIWANAGMSMQSFADIRKYIIKEAEERTDAVFIREKIKLAERGLHDRRTISIGKNNTGATH